MDVTDRNGLTPSRSCLWRQTHRQRVRVRLGPSPFNTRQLLARFGNQVMIEVNASDGLAGFEHEAPDTLEESPPSIFVNLKPGAARILDGDAPCIFHCPLRTCGRFGRAKATACLSWCKARV